MPAQSYCKINLNVKAKGISSITTKVLFLHGLYAQSMDWTYSQLVVQPHKVCVCVCVCGYGCVCRYVCEGERGGREIRDHPEPQTLFGFGLSYRFKMWHTQTKK